MANTKSIIKDKALPKDCLASYKSGMFGAEVVLAPAKVGKTMTIVGNLLGIMPWQEYGGVVDKPENLHVITFDAVTLEGALDFYINQCGAPPEIGNVHVINLENEANQAFASTQEYDPTFIQKVYDAVHNVQDRTTKGGTHALVIASLTICAKAWLRSISGPAFGGGKKSSMDRNKWDSFGRQLTEFQFATQNVQKYHTIWETHWKEKESTKTDSMGNKLTYDSIQVQGSAGEQFPAQCARPYMLKRLKGGWQPKSKVDMVEWDTQPNLDFGESVMAGRKVVGVLEPKEKDLTLMFNKLGLQIGGWGT